MLKKIVALAVVLGASFALTGCSDPCGDLQDICDGCGDDPIISVKAGCQVVVDTDDSDLCDAAIDSYEALCP